jgi:AmmeMemoRadiSam system protein A
MPAPEHPIAKLAWEAIRTYVEQGKVLKPPEEIPEELKSPGGVFVSIKKAGELRGCIGTIEATQPTRAEEIIKNAIHAATMDPRFPPLQPPELEAIEVSVDILKSPQRVEDLSSLDPKRYGIIVSARGLKALLLPDIEGVESAEHQVELARRKAGIGPEEKLEIERFETLRYR